MKKGKDNRLMPKEKKQKIHNTPSPASTSKKARTKKITIGWMHRDLSQDRYVSVRATKGGGTRKIDLPILSTKDEIVAAGTELFFQGTELFFQDDVSSHGCAENMVFNIANFKGEMISDNINNDGHTEPFTLEQYINKYKLVHVRIYLTSKPGDDDEEEEENFSDIDDDILLKPGPVSGSLDISKLQISDLLINEEQATDLHSDFDPEDSQFVEITSVTKSENHKSITDTNVTTNTIPPSPFLLIGTSDERKQLLIEQSDAYNESLEKDRRNEKEKANLEKNLHRLEAKRAARLLRLPKEPGLEEARVRVAVQHLTEGKLIRYFRIDCIASAIYDWSGSCASEPENFKLCLYTGQVVDLFEPVYIYILVISIFQT